MQCTECFGRGPEPPRVEDEAVATEHVSLEGKQQRVSMHDIIQVNNNKFIHNSIQIDSNRRTMLHFISNSIKFTMMI